MNEDFAGNIIIEVKVQEGSINAIDNRGNSYKVESVTLGIGRNKKSIKYTKNFLTHTDKYRAEILPNGKLNIL